MKLEWNGTLFGIGPGPPMGGCPFRCKCYEEKKLTYVKKRNWRLLNAENILKLFPVILN